MLPRDGGTDPDHRRNRRARLGSGIAARRGRPIGGDRRADKARVARIVELVPGLRAVNAGGLETARIVEQLTPLLISINARYKSHAGIRITELPEGDHWE